MGTCKDSFYVPNGGEGTISPVLTSHWNAPTVNPEAAQWWTMNQPILRRMFRFYQGALSQRGRGGRGADTFSPHTSAAALLIIFSQQFSLFSHSNNPAWMLPNMFPQHLQAHNDTFREQQMVSESTKNWMDQVSVADMSLCLNPLHPLPRTCGRCARSRAERAPLQSLQQNRQISPSSSGFAPRGRLAGLRSRHRFTE